MCMSTVFFACQKGISDNPNPTDTTGTNSGTQSDKLKDSVYLYTKEVYLWHAVIPSYAQFNPRGYSGATDLESATNVLNAIKALQPLDRYSFVVSKEQSDGLQTGASKDFGFLVQAAAADYAYPIDSVYWYVNYVLKNSNAGLAGVKRGWYISKINGTALGYNQSSVDLLNNTFFGTTSSATFEFTKNDGTTTSMNLTTSSYVANSVLFDTVYASTTGQNIGYLVFHQFLGQPSRTELAKSFAKFQAAGVNELIVDLRLNHGGSTDTQDTLADLIAPNSANNQKMYTYIYNDSLQAGKFPLLKNKFGLANAPSNIFAPAQNVVNFQKAGSLNLSRVVMITSRETASASELLINNLRPYMTVKLVGDTTYGKPVGFFPIDIYNLSIYPISFKTVNSQNNGDYYTGFAPDKVQADGVNKNWGDINEPSLYSSLSYLITGSYGRFANADAEGKRQLAIQKQFAPLNMKISNNRFSGQFIEKKLR